MTSSGFKIAGTFVPYKALLILGAIIIIWWGSTSVTPLCFSLLAVECPPGYNNGGSGAGIQQTTTTATTNVPEFPYALPILVVVLVVALLLVRRSQRKLRGTVTTNQAEELDS